MHNWKRTSVQVIGIGEVTYILLNGISVAQPVTLGENIELLPADTSHLDFETSVLTVSHPDDIAVVAAFIPRISAQFRISASTSKQLAIAAWNSSWDAILLSAILHTEIGFNLQSDTESTAIGGLSHLRATNHHMRGITTKNPHALTSEEATWINSNFPRARELLRDENFQTAVHCLASYRWHSMPRVKLAVLWAGIEGLFKATSEIRFRISLYISLFLHPDNSTERKETFDRIKKLYDLRSAAVHGGKLKDTAVSAVETSAQVLQKLILQCISNGSVPIESDLVP
jgi:hypothetical protein